MYIIRKEFHFSAAHELYGLPIDHQCARLHGHNYVVVVELRAKDLNEHSFVQDYGELKKVKQFIDDYLDHQPLHLMYNLIIAFPKQTSAENLAKFLFDYFKGKYPLLYAVEVSETPKTNARYEKDESS